MSLIAVDNKDKQIFSSGFTTPELGD